MLKNRPILLLFCAALLWETSSNAMLKTCEKTAEQLFLYIKGCISQNQKNNQTIEKSESKNNNQIDYPLPFATAYDAKKAYKKLWRCEEELSGLITISLKKPEAAIKKHQSELMIFCQRLFGYIVKKDIERNAPYTVDLGLTIDKKSGRIAMQRLPLTKKQRYIQNFLLFFSRDEKQKNATLSLLEEFLKNRNHPIDTPQSFFPRIILAKKLEKCYGYNSIAYYDTEERNIYFKTKDFMLENLIQILHEFGHHLQNAQADAYGSTQLYLLSNEYPTLPHHIRIEINAEIFSIYHHPHRAHLRKLVKKEAPYDINECFPYFNAKQRYNIVNYSLEKNNITTRAIKKTYDDFEAYGQGIINKCKKLLEKNASSEENAHSYDLIKQEETNRHNFLKKLQKNFVKKDVMDEKDLDAALQTINGCEDFFKIKKTIFEKIEKKNDDNIAA